MSLCTASPSAALATYERLAPCYDQLTEDHDYELWLGNLLPAARRFGLKGRRLLDVACGTGKSFLPLLDRGWEVTACDLSPAMLAQAKSKVGDSVRFETADMRQLPVLGSFDLVLCLGDAVNYLLELDELESCLASVRANLAPGGMLLFDTNTLRTFRASYTEERQHNLTTGRVNWRGQAPTTLEPGSVVEAGMEIATDQGRPGRAIHRQRHFRPAEVLDALGCSGLECLAHFGHGFDARLEQPLDEERHTKAIFIARNTEERR
jgi:SAM-dependent methyltransferase